MSSSEATIKIRGSEGDIYEIHAASVDGVVRFTCTCPAGQNGQLCKHRISVLTGLKVYFEEGLSSRKEWGRITDILAADGITKAYKQFATEQKRLEAEAERVKKDLTKLKKALARKFEEGC